jgi:hypothetical protein
VEYLAEHNDELPLSTKLETILPATEAFPKDTVVPVFNLEFLPNNGICTNKYTCTIITCNKSTF